MYRCMLAFCVGLVLAGVFPNRSLLGLLGALLVAVSLLALLALLIGSLARSAKSREWQWRQAAAGIFLLFVGLLAVICLGSPSPETRIERALEAVAAGNNPAHCRELMTEPYLEQTTGAHGPFADDACRRETVGRPVHAVEVKTIAVDGGRAVARVLHHGGSLDGSTELVELVELDDRWKLNRVLAIPRLDRKRFRRAYWRTFREFGSPRRSAACALRAEQALSDAEVKRALLTDVVGVFAPIAVRCDRAGIERSIASTVAGAELALPPAAVACAERRIRAASDTELVGLRADPLEYGRLILACDETAIRRYVRRETKRAGLDAAGARCVEAPFRSQGPIDGYELLYDEDRYEALFERCASA